MNKSPIYMILTNGYAGLDPWPLGRGERRFGIARTSRHALDWFGGVLLLWLHRGQSRRALLDLNDQALRDIGLTRDDALREGRKPFWR